MNKRTTMDQDEGLLLSEDGMLSWATLIAVFCFCCLIAMVFNVGRIANDKLEAQNAADSAAYSASLVQARAMNAITASNHLMGELTTLYTMHHSMTDKNSRTRNGTVSLLNTANNVMYNLAYVAHFITVWQGGRAPVRYANFWSDAPRGKTTTYDAKCLLKWRAFEAYSAHFASAFMWKWFVWKGKPVQSAANLQLTLLRTEYQIIDKIESFTANSISLKNSIPPIMSLIYSYQSIVARGVRLQAARAASAAAEKNMCVGEVAGRPSAANIASSFGGIPSGTIPVNIDPANNAERTQLMRATYPWVQDWRGPFLKFAYVVLPNSRASIFYEYHTDFFTKKFCNDFRKDRGFRLYVLEEMNGDRVRTDKGTESWRKRSQSKLADEMFCVVGFARKEAPPANTHLAFLPRTNSAPIAAMAQAMQYNGLRPKLWQPGFYDKISFLIDRRPQPVQGWDTLNWSEGATEWKNGKPYCGLPPADWRWTVGIVGPIPDIAYPPDLFPPSPRVRLSWRSKLVPVSTVGNDRLSANNLEKRISMIQDSEIKGRMFSQVIPATLAERAGIDFINH